MRQLDSLFLPIRIGYSTLREKVQQLVIDVVDIALGEGNSDQGRGEAFGARGEVVPVLRPKGWSPTSKPRSARNVPIFSDSGKQRKRHL